MRLTILPPSCAVVMKFGNLNFLEPSGPLQTCNGTALPLPFYSVQIVYVNSTTTRAPPSDICQCISLWEGILT